MYRLLLRVVTSVMLISIVFSLTAFADNSSLTIQNVESSIDMYFETLKNTFAESGLTLWYDVAYYETGLLSVEYAIDGLAEIVFEAINAGYDEKWETFNSFKTFTHNLYDEISAVVLLVNDENLRINCRLVSDIAYIHGDWSIPCYVLYGINQGMFSTTIENIMQDAKAPIPTRRPQSIAKHSPITVKKEEVSILDEETTQKLLIEYFEWNNVPLWYDFTGEPYLKKDEGLYGGKERWWICLKDGELMTIWTLNGEITYVYDGVEYWDAKIYVIE